MKDQTCKNEKKIKRMMMMMVMMKW